MPRFELRVSKTGHVEVDELKRNIAGVLKVLRERGRKSVTGPEMCRLIEASGWPLKRINLKAVLALRITQDAGAGI